MKLDELEKECGRKTEPINDPCQRASSPSIPMNQTVPNPQLNGGFCKIIRYTPDPTQPKGWREHVEWLDTNKLPTVQMEAKKKHDSHLGGVEADHHIPGIEQDIAAASLRYAYPYTDEFTREDWAGIN